LLSVIIVLASVVGCGTQAPHVAIPISVPEEFSDEKGIWQHSADAPSKADNQQIGKFFKRNPDLIGSPEWTGQPEKYVCKGSKSLTRFYWLNGNGEHPTWNALETEGSRIRELSGTGNLVAAQSN
jgi:hypothetical protein